VDQLPLKKTYANVNIAGVIADVAIKQVYKNEGINALEAIYTFPASTKAAIYSMEMIIGNRKITAQIEDKQKARKDYEQAKNEGKRTSLLEQQRPNVFQTNVANILPGDEITVVLKYTELLVPENGTYQFVYPTVVGPRYSNVKESDAAEEDQFVATPYQKDGELPFYDFDIQVSLNAGIPIQNIVCSTHKTNIAYQNASSANINLAASETKGGNRDFILEYQLSGEQIQSGLMLYEHEDEDFFLFMIQPPKQIKSEDIPPREYIFIVDVSGSMRGFPLTISKKLMRNLIVNLRSTDQFNILLFAGTSGLFNAESVSASEENINKAILFIDDQRGGGGTELLPALQSALNLPRKYESLSRSFVIITDGYVTVEKEAFKLIRKHSNEANTFVFGIGSGVNRYLIEGMAHAGMGESIIVTKSENANEKAAKFRNYINNPVLTQIKRKFNGFEVFDVEPVSSPDVFAERPVVIFGKYKREPAGTLTLKGYTGNKNYKSTFDVSTVKPDKSNLAIRYLWARERIKLLDDYDAYNSDSASIREVTNLGLKYNLMTAYTSFIAIDEQKVVENGQIKTVKQTLPLPHGVSNSAIGFDLAIDGISLNGVQLPDKKVTDNIEVFGEITKAEKEKVRNFLKENLTSQIENCNAGNYLKIEVIIDKFGKVSKINFIESDVDTQTKRCIEEHILQLNFNQFNLNKNWKYTLKT
ncbi:MAG: VIT and VWA domain-containing protein, partial [Bacteroidales bacterium]|nr:VIT and VWA domain-containing protein [Bacteroidales bacterium]